MARSGRSSHEPHQTHSPYRVKGFDSMLTRTLITGRRLLLKMQIQMSNQIRGLLKTFGLIAPKGVGSVFERNVRALLEGDAALAQIILPLLQAWSDVWRQVAELTDRWSAWDARASIAACSCRSRVSGS
jgi:transposase